MAARLASIAAARSVELRGAEVEDQVQLAEQQVIAVRDYVRAVWDQPLAVEDRVVAAVQVGDEQPLFPALKLAVLPRDAKLLRPIGAEVDQAIRVGAEAAA